MREPERGQRGQPAMDSKRAECRMDMHLDSARRYSELARDHLIGMTCQKEPDHLLLPLSQFGQGLKVEAIVFFVLISARRLSFEQVGRNKYAIFPYRLQRSNQFRAVSDLLRDKSLRTGGENGQHLARICPFGKDRHAHRRIFLVKFAYRRQSRSSRQIEGERKQMNGNFSRQDFDEAFVVVNPYHLIKTNIPLEHRRETSVVE